MLSYQYTKQLHQKNQIDKIGITFIGSSKTVRAWNHPGGQMICPVPGEPNKCEFMWLMNIDFRGWLPGSVMEMAMPQAQLQFAASVKRLSKTL